MTDILSQECLSGRMSFGTHQLSSNKVDASLSTNVRQPPFEDNGQQLSNLTYEIRFVPEVH